MIKCCSQKCILSW